MYTAVLTDAISRWKQMKRMNVKFATGTDEHGMKIQKAAAAMRRNPLDYCTDISNNFKEMFSTSNISYTDFIRTTEERHKAAVHHFWKILFNNGHIYKGHYEGWYSVSDEAFLSNDAVEETRDRHGKYVHISKESGHVVEWMKEENYMFRLSCFTDQLRSWVDKNVIRPKVFEPAVRSWITSLQDLSISREVSRLQWGIPVPGDNSQTIYVWLDALLNYLSVTGYPNSGWETWWPADCHVVGKDILKFHAIYWPAFLMAAGLEPPKMILCHSHWMVNNKKMSKSIGNVVDPFDRMKKYSADGFRYFLLKEGVPHSDGNYNDNKVVEMLNAELCNTLGNLLSRCTGKALNPQQVFPSFDPEAFEDCATEEGRNLLKNLKDLPSVVHDHYDDYHIYKGLEAIVSQLHSTNAFFQHHKPWELKTDKSKQKWLDTILHVTMENLRVCGVLLKPVIPDSSEKILSKLGARDYERTLESIMYVDDLQSSRICDERPLGVDSGLLFPRLKK
ncbi:methionine--tRNA ligase, mitochondrial-like isoform X2 [Lineus longissimus]